MRYYCLLLSFGFLMLAGLACELPGDDSRERAQTERWIGTWQLSTVRGYNADSIESRHLLTLFADSTYQSTIALWTNETHDTTMLINQLRGRWETHRWKTEGGFSSQTGIHISSDTSITHSVITRSWSYLSGGRSERRMHFFTGGISTTFDLSWTLVE